jgi:hypothetical protein
MLVFFFLFTLLTSPNHFLFSILTSSDFFILFQYFLFGFFLCHAKLFLRYADLRLIIYENLKKKKMEERSIHSKGLLFLLRSW